MKKRILSMLLVATTIMGIFTGCGANGTGSNSNGLGFGAKEITVSEMLESVTSETGEVHILTCTTSNYVESYPTDKWKVWSYKGKENPSYLLLNNEKENHSLTDWLSALSKGSYTLAENVCGIPYIVIDNTDENAMVEGLKTWNPNPSIYFGKCEHVTIDSVSYMLFTTYCYDSKYGPGSMYFTLIKDNDYTKDKIVVVDEITDDVRITNRDNNNGIAYFSELPKED